MLMTKRNCRMGGAQWRLIYLCRVYSAYQGITKSCLALYLLRKRLERLHLTRAGLLAKLHLCAWRPMTMLSRVRSKR